MRYIKTGVLNYLKSLKCFFTPIGVVFFGIMLGLSAFIPGVINAVKALFDGVSELLGNIPFDFNAVKDALFSSVTTMDWSNPAETVSVIASEEWLVSTFMNCINAFFGDTTAIAESLNELLSKCAGDIIKYILISIVWNIAAFIFGFYFTRRQIKKDIAKRKIRYDILNAVINIAMFLLCVRLMSEWKGSIYVSVIISLLIFGIVALIEAYLSQGGKKVKFFKVVNPWNVLALFVTDIIIAAIAVGLALIVWKASNFILAFFVGISTIEIAIMVISLNSDSYVAGLVKKIADNSPVTVAAEIVDPALSPTENAESETATAGTALENGMQAEVIATENQPETEKTADDAAVIDQPEADSVVKDKE